MVGSAVTSLSESLPDRLGISFKLARLDVWTMDYTSGQFGRRFDANMDVIRTFFRQFVDSTTGRRFACSSPVHGSFSPLRRRFVVVRSLFLILTSPRLTALSRLCLVCVRSGGLIYSAVFGVKGGRPCTILTR